MADPQPTDSSGLDPAMLAAMQGGFGAPMQQRMYDAPPPMPDASMLPAPVAQAVQNGFAPPVPPGVVDGLGAPGAPQMLPPPAFQPQPLANPFPAMAPTAVAGAEQGAAPSKADVAAAKEAVAAQAADAKAQAKQAAYDATPQGQFEQAAKIETDANRQQSDIAGKQGDVESQAALEAATIRDQGIIDQQKLIDDQNKAQAAAFAERKQMLDGYSKAVDEQAKKTVDPNRMYNSQSTAQHIGTAAGIFLAGLGSGQGENPALKMISQAIDRDIDAQKENINKGDKDLANKKGLIEDYGHLSDKQNEQLELRRAQYYKMEGDKLLASAAHYGSPKALLAAQQGQAELYAKRGTILANLADKRQADNYKQAELRNQRDQIGIAGFNATTGRLELVDKAIARKDAAQERRDLQKEAEDAKLAEIAARKGKAVPGGFMVPTGIVKAPDGKVQAHFTPLTNEDGEQFAAPEKTQEDLYKNHAATASAVDAEDKVLQAIETTGGNFTNMSSDARSKLQESMRALIKTHEALGIGGFKGNVAELVNKAMTGSLDENISTSMMQDVRQQFRQAREDLVHDRLQKFRSAGYTGPADALDIPSPVDNKPPESGESKLMKTFETPAQKMPAGLPAEVIRAAQQDPNGYAAQQVAKANGANLSDDQAAAIRVMAHSLNSPTTRASATKMLDKIVADPAATAASKQAAQALLDTLGRPKVTKDPELP